MNVLVISVLLLCLTVPAFGFLDYNANWWRSFDKKGWSMCAEDSYMTGLWRNAYANPDKIYRIEMAHCRSAPGFNRGRFCYSHNWRRSFDHIGWSTCKDGHFMRGLFRSSGQYLHNIESAKCCQPAGFKNHWGKCYIRSVYYSFDKKGWSKCKKGYYMVGLYRNSCDELFCLEAFKCCKMAF